MKNLKLKYLIAVLGMAISLGFSGSAAALGTPGDTPGVPPGFPGGSAPGFPKGSPPGFPPQCEDLAEAKSACRQASIYCDAALEDWKDPHGLNSNNLRHCAYHSKKCGGYFGESEYTEFLPQEDR